MMEHLIALTKYVDVLDFAHAKQAGTAHQLVFILT